MFIDVTLIIKKVSLSQFFYLYKDYGNSISIKDDINML